MAARQLTRNSLVDDVGGGGSQEDVQRMRGDKVDGSYTGTITELLGQCGFRAKAIVSSGSEDPEELEALGDRFLGLGFLPSSDEIVLKVAPHIRMQRKRSRQRRANNEIITESWMENLRTGGQIS